MTMNEQYQKFIDSNDSDSTKKSLKFYFELLDKHYIDISSETITTIEQLEKEQLRTDLPNFAPGDTVKVQIKVKEGDKERLQAFEGVVMARKGSGISETFTVRKISYGVGVERVFPLHSPKVAKITVTRTGKVRRAKLTFLRKLVGQYKVEERA